MLTPPNEKFSEHFGQSVRAMSDYIGIGLQIAVSFALFVLGGYWLDAHFKTSPLFLLVGVLLGMVGMVLVLLKVIRQTNSKK